MKNEHAYPVRLGKRGEVLILTIALLLAGCLHLSARGGSAYAAYYSLDDGLASREVRSIFQDDRGFIWIGTANGVNRFDGYRFETFDNLPGTEFRISDDDVTELGQTRENKLFIRYNNNPVFFDLLDLDTYETTKVFLMPKTGIDGFVQHVHLTPEGDIYVLSLNDEGVNIYQYRPDDQFERVAKIPGAPREDKTSQISFLLTHNQEFLLNDRKHGLLLVARSGLIRQTFSAEDLGLSPDYAANYPGEVNIFHQDKRGRAWISFQRIPGLFSLQPSNDQGYEVIQPDFLPQPKYYTRLWEDKQGALLIGEPGSLRNATQIKTLFCLKPDGASLDFTHLVDPRQQTTAVYGANFFSVIFFGLDTGFKIVQNNQSTVKAFLREDISEDQRGAIMRGMVSDGKDKVYVAQEEQGWYILDLKTDFLDTLQIVDRNGVPIPLDCSMNLHLDNRGFLWGFSCRENGSGVLIKYDTANCFAETFVYDHQFNAMVPAADGGFWLVAFSRAGRGQLVYFDPQKNQFKEHFRRDDRNPLKNAFPFYIESGRSGHLYIGTNQGFYIVDPRTDSVTVYRQTDETGAAPGLRSNDIWVIHEAEDGRIWLGTSNGLSILDPATGHIHTLDKDAGLPSNSVCGILPDGQGNYWISTYDGLSFYSPQYELFRKFYSADGFSHNEFNRFSFAKDHRGRFYFGGVNGFNAFYPSDLIIATPTPSPQITQVTRFSSGSDSIIHQKRGLQSMKFLEVKPYDAYFQIHFMLPVFSHTDKNQFSAWLEGYEPDWSNLGSSPFVRYSSLPPGRYTLHINGSDPNGNPSQNPIRLEIRVRPKFYITWWFISFCGALIIGLGYGLFRYQLDQQLRVERLRTRLSSDIHDEVSGLLSGIAMQADVLREISGDDYLREKLQSIGETSRKAMSKMSDIIWSTDSRKDRMCDLVERMREHADDILLKVNIAYDFRVDKVDQSRKIPVHIRQNLYFIYKEAINNIAKHADARRVQIRLANSGNNFQMIIHNDGHPRLNGKKKTGQGLSNIKMRAQRISANVNFHNHDGFTVKLSMKKFV